MRWRPIATGTSPDNRCRPGYGQCRHRTRGDDLETAGAGEAPGNAQLSLRWVRLEISAHRCRRGQRYRNFVGVADWGPAVASDCPQGRTRRPGGAGGYQLLRSRSGTTSKCWSRLRTGSRYCSASAAIQASLAGIGRPDRLSATRSVAYAIVVSLVTSRMSKWGSCETSHAS